MVTNLRIKLATIMLLALTLIAVSIPVMATVYQNGGENAVKDCATAGEENVCLPTAQPSIVSEMSLACNEPTPAAELECNDSECGSVTVPAEDVECAQDSRPAESVCTSAESACDTVKASTTEKACSDSETQGTVKVCNGSKTCTANKICNGSKTTNATACNLNKTTTANKACSDNKATNIICNGSKTSTCPDTTKDCTPELPPAVPECAD